MVVSAVGTGPPLERLRKIPALLFHRTLFPLARKPILGVHQSGAGSVLIDWLRQRAGAFATQDRTS